MQTNEPNQEKFARKFVEWSHDRQPSSSFYNSESPDTNESKKKKTKASQDSVSDSHPEDNSDLVPSSLPATHRFSFRIMEKHNRHRTETTKREPHDIATAIRTLNSSIFNNESEIEKTKEHKSKLKREIKRLWDLVSNDDAVIRTYERTNMQLKTQREAMEKRAFALNYR